VALIGNYSVLTKNPGRDMSGSSVSDTPGAWNKAGMQRAAFVSGAGYLATSATPNSYTHPYAWNLAESDGASTESLAAAMSGVGDVSALLSAVGSLEVALSGDGALVAQAALVVSAVAALSGSGTISSAQAALIMSAVASLSGTGSMDAIVEAIGQVGAALDGSGAITQAALGALVSAVASLSGVGSIAAAVRADALVSAELTPFTELSPQAIAAAVWNSLAASFNNVGTMGEALNSGGGGGGGGGASAAQVWAAVASANATPGSMGEALRQLFLIAGLDPANPMVTDGESRRVPADGSLIDQTVITVGDTTTVTTEDP
jgi:hypothetical protein